MRDVKGGVATGWRGNLDRIYGIYGIGDGGGGTESAARLVLLLLSEVLK